MLLRLQRRNHIRGAERGADNQHPGGGGNAGKGCIRPGIGNEIRLPGDAPQRSWNGRRRMAHRQHQDIRLHDAAAGGNLKSGIPLGNAQRLGP